MRIKKSTNISPDNSWKNSVIYQIYPRSFKDSNDDGIGDLRGIIDKLDYFKGKDDSLGVNVIWISPIYNSPMKDFGYDVQDYQDIDPIFGNLEDFNVLIEEAHKRGIKVMMDFIPSHTSDQHSWFLDSSRSKESAKRDWYIWRDPNPDGSVPNNWISPFGGSMWEFDKKTGQYYLHTFVKEQPDLNWRNLEVQETMVETLRFWLGKGVDGFRVDALNHIYKDMRFLDEPLNPNYKPEKHNPYDRLSHIYIENQPELLPLIRTFSKILASHKDTFMVTESYIDFSQMLRFYKAGGANHAPFNFQFLSLDWQALTIKKFINEFDKKLGSKYIPTYVLGNHDQHRVASRLGQKAARLAAMLQLTLRGVPTIYYGEELGMENVKIQRENVQDPWEINVPGLGRDPERTPMQWDATAFSGFSNVNPWLPLSSDYRIRNVAVESKDPQSTFNLYKKLLKLRRTLPELLFGEYVSCDIKNEYIYAYFRKYEKKRILVLLNFSSEDQVVPLPNPAKKILLSTYMDRGVEENLTDTVSLRSLEGIVIQI